MARGGKNKKGKKATTKTANHHLNRRVGEWKKKRGKRATQTCMADNIMPFQGGRGAT